MFYFITFLYILAFTMDEETKGSRKYMLVLAVIFLAYEYYIHEHPGEATVIDFIDNKIPLFEQRNIFKRTLIILIAIVRSYFIKKRTEEKVLI